MHLSSTSPANTRTTHRHRPPLQQQQLPRRGEAEELLIRFLTLDTFTINLALNCNWYSITQLHRHIPLSYLSSADDDDDDATDSAAATSRPASHCSRGIFHLQNYPKLPRRALRLAYNIMIPIGRDLGSPPRVTITTTTTTSSEWPGVE